MLNKQSRSAPSKLYILVALAFVVSLFTGCAEKKKEMIKEERAVPVITGKVSLRRVEYILHQVGSLKASQEVMIRSEIEGRVVEILFSEGKKVEKGQMLLRLDRAKIDAEMQNLDARIEQLRIRLVNKRKNLNRNEPLVESNLVSRLQFDNLQTEIKEMQEEISQAVSARTFQRERLSDTVIRAPFNGIAGVRNISLGEYLKVGDSVVTVVDLDSLEASFHAQERFKPRLFTDQEVLLKVEAYPNKVFKGIISFLAPQIDVSTRTFQVKARVNNREGLLNPGMFARVEVITDVHENALTVPWESVIHAEDGTYIYVVQGSIARKVPVRLGHVTIEWAEIVNTDLTPEAEVILEGKFAVRDGAKVVIQNVPKTEIKREAAEG